MVIIPYGQNKNYGLANRKFHTTPDPSKPRQLNEKYTQWINPTLLDLGNDFLWMARQFMSIPTSRTGWFPVCRLTRNCRTLPARGSAPPATACCGPNWRLINHPDPILGVPTILPLTISMSAGFTSLTPVTWPAPIACFPAHRARAGP